MPYTSFSALHKLSNLGVKPEHPLGKARYIRLVNQLSLFVGLVSLGFALTTYEGEPLLMRITELLAPLVMAVIPWLNSRGHHQLARTVLYLEINLYCLLTALLMGSSTGEHLYFIPILFGTALIFDLRKWQQLIMVVSIPVAALALLFYLGDAYSVRQQEALQWQGAYGANLLVTILSGFVLALFYYFITFQQQRELKGALQQQANLNQSLSEKERSLQQNLRYSDMLLANLKTSKNYFQALIQNAADIVCVTDDQGTIKYLTPSFYRLTGYQPEDTRNRKVFDFVHPEDLSEGIERFMGRVQGSSSEPTFMFRYRKVDGGYLYLEANGTNLLDNRDINGLVINARDVTERVLYQQQIERKERNIRSILDNNPSIIWMVDTESRLLDCNASFIRYVKAMYGIAIKRGMRLNKLIPPEEVAKWAARYKAAKAGRIEEALERVQFNGLETIHRVCVYPVYTEGRVDRFTVFAEDITNQKRAEDALVQAKEQAEGASSLKAQFVSTMSHELRTPMNAILGMTHLLMQESPRPDQSENLRLLKFSAENMLNLVNDVLDFSRYESGRMELEQVDFSIEELACNLTDSLQPVARERKLTLRYLTSEQLPTEVVGDPGRLSQILSNLLSNALKFTEEGEVILRIKTLQLNQNNCTLHFSVQDTGIGIPEEKQEIIFESFTQAEASTTRKYGGTGLGLAISRRLLEMHNSQMVVSSQAGEGSTFSFTLTYQLSESLNQPTMSTPHPSSDQSSSIHLLLVEDNPLNRFVTEKFLTRWGFTFSVAETGQEALEHLEREEYQLVLMDLQLPDIDGYEITRRLREGTTSNKDVPVMAMSASTEPHIQAKAFAAGMQEYMIKPFNPDNFRNRILELAGSQRTLRMSS